MQVQCESRKRCWVACAIQVYLSYEQRYSFTYQVRTTYQVGLFYHYYYSVFEDVLFITHWTHAIRTQGFHKIRSQCGTKHRHLAVISFLSHVPLLHTWNLHRISRRTLIHTTIIYYPNLLYVIKEMHIYSSPNHSIAVWRREGKKYIERIQKLNFYLQPSLYKRRIVLAQTML